MAPNRSFGLARQECQPVHHLSVDETSFTKRHQYVANISDQQTGAVLHVADDRSGESLATYLRTLSMTERKTIRIVSMNMWPACISAAMTNILEAAGKICFDKFHVAQHLSRAVNLVRRSEHKVLLSRGDRPLSKTKYLWLRNPNLMAQTAYEQL